MFEPVSAPVWIENPPFSILIVELSIALFSNLNPPLSFQPLVNSFEESIDRLVYCPKEVDPAVDPVAS